MTTEEMNLELEQRAKELLDNEEFLEKIWYAETADSLMQAFEEYNIVLEGVSKEEAFDAFQRVKSGELSEDDLSNVSGGLYFMFSLKAGAIAVSGATLGTALALVGGVAVIGLATYAGYRLIKKYTR